MATVNLENLPGVLVYIGGIIATMGYFARHELVTGVGVSIATLGFSTIPFIWARAWGKERGGGEV